MIRFRAIPALLILLLAGCDRPFGDVGEAEVVVVRPDVSIATSDESITLELDVTSVRDIVSVQTGSTEFGYTGSGDRWQAVLPLNPGLNRFLIESVVDSGPTAIDTVDVLRVETAYESLTAQRPLLFGTGGHSMTRLEDDTVVLIGGSSRPASGGTFDGWTLASGSDRFRPVLTQTIAPRVGHTSTLLPDGRILILGGGQFGDIASTDELVETVEIFDPETEVFSEIPFRGEAIRRMYHTAILQPVGQDVFVVLLGGRGDTQYLPAPVLGIRQDMRTFQLRGDTLHALSPAIGPFIEHVGGHTWMPIDALDESDAMEFLVAGTRFDQDLLPTAFVMDFASAAGLDVSRAGALNQQRVRHASAVIEPGFVAHFTGWDENTQQIVPGGEIYVAEANKHFRFPPELDAQITSSYGLTATRMADGRIMLLGGFDSEATGLSTLEFVSLGVR